MSDELPGTRFASVKGLVVTAAIVLAATGASFGYVFGLGLSGRVIQPRPFTPEVKRTLVAELEAAQVERRRHGMSPAVYAQVRRALGLAAAHGQTRLATYIGPTFHAGCTASESLYGLVRALEIAREAPVVGAVERRATRPTKEAGL